MPVRLTLAAVVLLAGSTAARAAGCDLDAVMGYQLVKAWTIQGYIDNGQQIYGFEGCVPGRILVFSDRSGLRCKGTWRAHLELPKAWLFGRSRDDLKLCVGDQLYDVEPIP
ncbi:MAG: hypothetical protein ABSC95_13800 [Acetobacteraceae bacterium]|jgi:hypothetical protein